MTNYPTEKARTEQIAKATRKRRVIQDTYVRISHIPRIGEFYAIAQRYIQEARLIRQAAIIGRKPIPDPTRAIAMAKCWLGYGRALRREMARQAEGGRE